MKEKIIPVINQFIKIWSGWNFKYRYILGHYL